MAKLTKDQRSILDKLEELGGRAVRHDDITFEGTKFIIPESMAPRKALQFLSQWIENQEEIHQFGKVYPYRWFDGANATYEVLNNLYGGVIGVATRSFFGSTPPRFLEIPIGPTETKQIPIGQVAFPLVEGTLNIGAQQDDEMGQVFWLTAQCPKKYKSAIEGLFAAIEVYLREHSIYRGKAFDGRETPNFLDLSGVDESKIIYTQEVYDQLEANVWGLLYHTQKMREWGLPLKRSILLEGPYGTGKTLAAYLTAQKAVEHGWTFVYCRPSKDNLGEVLQTARLYQPAVVFFEDVDVIAEGEGNESDRVSRLLDAFDGINAKNTEIVAMLTTNHADKIHQGMLRPGRLDAVVSIGKYDHDATVRLVKSLVPIGNLDPDIDWEKVAEAMEGYLPAFVREAVDRASRFAIVRSGGEGDIITTPDLVLAAQGLRAQHKMMNEAPEHSGAWTIDKGIQAKIEGALTRTSLQDLYEPLLVSPERDAV